MAAMARHGWRSGPPTSAPVPASPTTLPSSPPSLPPPHFRIPDSRIARPSVLSGCPAGVRRAPAARGAACVPARSLPAPPPARPAHRCLDHFQNFSCARAAGQPWPAMARQACWPTNSNSSSSSISPALYFSPSPYPPKNLKAKNVTTKSLKAKDFGEKLKGTWSFGGPPWMVESWRNCGRATDGRLWMAMAGRCQRYGVPVRFLAQGRWLKQAMLIGRIFSGELRKYWAQLGFRFQGFLG